MTNEEVAAILMAHRDAHDGKMDAEELVTEASDPSHPLHDDPRWEWDEKKAARKYNVIKAKEIIRSVRIPVETKDKQVISAPMFIREPTRRHPTYGLVTEIRSDRDASREALLAAMKRVVTALQYAQTLAKVFELDSDLEMMKDQMVALMGRVTIDDQPAGSA